MCPLEQWKTFFCLAIRWTQVRIRSETVSQARHHTCLNVTVETCSKTTKTGLFLIPCHHPTSRDEACAATGCAAASFSLDMTGKLFLDTVARANAYDVHVDIHGTDCVHTHAWKVATNKNNRLSSRITKKERVKMPFDAILHPVTVKKMCLTIYFGITENMNYLSIPLNITDK